MNKSLNEWVFSPQEVARIKHCHRAIHLPKASFIITTYNRCPFKNPRLNPLIWALQTIINSKESKIDELIVVDDGSSDYTESALKWFVSKNDTNLVYLRNSQRKGCSLSRSIGINNSSNGLFFLGDDDCLYKPFFIFGSLLTFTLMKMKYKDRLAVLNLPSFERETGYRENIDIKYIGKTDFRRQWFYHNFDKYPNEYLSKAMFLGKDEIVLKPFKVDTFAGTTLNDKRAILAAGNFADFSMWENDYPEHIELSVRLQRQGYLIFHQPDQRIASVHLRYGSKTEKRISKPRLNICFDGINYCLSELIKMSDRKIANSGCRVSDRIFSICQIGSFFSFYLKMSPKMGEEYAIRELKLFVVDSQLDRDKLITRYKTWEKAIKKGIRVSRKQTGKSYQRVYKKVFKRAEALLKKQYPKFFSNDFDKVRISCYPKRTRKIRVG